MLRIIKQKLNKTPVQNTSTIIRKVERIDKSVVETLLSSHLLGEGVYGFEVVANSEDTEQYLVTPAVFRESIGIEVHTFNKHLYNDISNLHCYNIILSKPSFLPLYSTEPL